MMNLLFSEHNTGIFTDTAVCIILILSIENKVLVVNVLVKNMMVLCDIIVF